MSTTTESLRRAVAGLIGLAASEQQRLAVAADSAEVGSPQRYSGRVKDQPGVIATANRQ